MDRPFLSLWGLRERLLLAAESGVGPLPIPCKTGECNKAGMPHRAVQVKTMHLILTPVYNWEIWQGY